MFKAEMIAPCGLTYVISGGYTSVGNAVDGYAVIERE